MPRFVVLTHDHPALHWDFMLEKEAVLRTWRLELPPDHQGTIRADPLSDHRLAYLDYEGPVSGNRGSVRRWDRGEYRSGNESAERIEVELLGEKLMGIAILERLPESGAWRFQFSSTRTSSPDLM